MGYRLVIGGFLAVVFAAVVRGETPELRYGFQARSFYAYDITIKVETKARIETGTATTLYLVENEHDNRIFLQVEGRMEVKRQDKPEAKKADTPKGMIPSPWQSLMEPGGLSSDSFHTKIAIDRSGKQVGGWRLTSLAYILGFAETIPLERLPTEKTRQWQAEEDFRMVQGDGHRPLGFGGDSRSARERTEYTLRDVQGDLVHIDKKYHMRTGDGAERAARAMMTGSGSVVFDRKAGVASSGTTNYNLQLKDGDRSETITASIDYRLVGPERLKTLLAEREERYRRGSGQAYTELPKTPLPRSERAKLLRDVNSTDRRTVDAALVRLISSVADGDRADFAVPLARILQNEPLLMQKAAWALVVWATPEAEAALAGALDRYHWAPEPVIEALVTIQTESAARVLSQQGMRSSRLKAVEALGRMGPLAERPALDVLATDRDVYRRQAACEVDRGRKLPAGGETAHPQAFRPNAACRGRRPFCGAGAAGDGESSAAI